MDWDANRPIWTPDGNKVTFHWGREGPGNIYWRPADGSGEAEQLTDNENAGSLYPTSWSPDARWLVYTRSQAGSVTLSDVWILDFEGDRTSRPLIQGDGNETQGEVSPDGRWLAYSSDESGRTEVYVQPFPDLGRRWHISTEGGDFPVWSPDGHELFYQQGQKLMAVATEVEPDFEAGVPRELFEFPFLEYGRRTFDVAPGGQRFVMIQDEDRDVAPTEIYLATNWATELARLVP